MILFNSDLLIHSLTLALFFCSTLVEKLYMVKYTWQKYSLNGIEFPVLNNKRKKKEQC